MLKKHLREIGIEMPRHLVLPLYQRDFDPRYADRVSPEALAVAQGSSEASGPREKYAARKARAVFEKFGSPWIVRSFVPNSSMGIHLAKTFPELIAAIEDGVSHETSILVEELVPGKIASVHSVAGFRGEEIYIFPLGNSFGEFSRDEKEKLAVLARNLHRHLGAGHYLKSDFVFHPRGRVYLLNIDSIPNLKEDSPLHEICSSVGAKVHQVVEHILERASI